MTAALSLLGLIAAPAANSHAIRIPVEGGNVVVTGPLDAINRDTIITCRACAVAGSSWSGRTQCINTNGTVITTTSVICQSEPAICATAVNLQVLNSQGHQLMPPLRGQMFATFDPAIDRRSYTHELAGSMVLVTDFEATTGRGPMVTATVVVVGTLFWLIPPTTIEPGQIVIIPFAFSDFPELPDAFDSSVKLQLYLNNNQTFVHHRRIVRIAPPPT